ncbi:RNA polymerase sigma factor [Kineococcus rhizosphaerae]|uniref:RNA polymerase sigma-70 factor (ECF subfamily) n=1 Tax=Kineococcus rhizosphaerae TaxID=559628 RepID=A0A2T0R168_9ACTN|nr:sigma-70 family RNA polymerase sigma factor [Kineococcus rhizosphaerae]PRY13037.1 RNA polymerase sigma-70 factor (ECF subfamily) [Kineococcus rhizosphaerae]
MRRPAPDEGSGPHADPHADPRSDEVLARRAGLGDREAFAAIVDRHGPALARYAGRLLDDAHQVEDCLQDTFLASWRGLPAFRGDASLRTWLFTLTRHAAFARLQRWPRSGSRPHVPVEEVADRLRDLREDPERSSVEGALREALDVALRLLPPRQRTAWLLREVEGLGYPEIAVVLGSSSTAVRGLLERARTTLANTLEEWR